MKDALVVLIIIIVVGLAIRYIIKEKKKGVACIGCPSASSCHGSCSNLDFEQIKKELHN